MGDGGLIAQFRNQAGQVVSVTSSTAKCLVIHYAPVQTSCADESDPQVGQGACASVSSEEPEGWMLAGFDDSDWENATEHSTRAVRPKGGYDDISWAWRSRIIWGPDLERDNTVLCRITLGE